MHLTEDDLVLHYYGELDPAASAIASEHLRECATCHASLTTLQRVLAAVESTPIDVGEGFERKAWARLQPELEARRKGWFSWFVLSPARLAWVAGIVVLVASRSSPVACLGRPSTRRSRKTRRPPSPICASESCSRTWERISIARRPC